MTLITNSAEGGTNGTACTGGSGGNTGGTSGRYFDVVSIAGSATIKFENTQTHDSSALGYAINTNAQDAEYLEWLPTTNNAFAARGWVYLPSLPSAGNAFINVRTASGGTSLLTIVINNSTVLVQDTNATTQFTGTAAPPTGEWLRWEIKATNGVSTTGTMTMDWYVGDSTTPITGLSASLTAQNFGTVAFGQFRIGRPGAPAGTWASFYMDDIAYNDGATSYIGPSTTTPLATPVLTITGQTDPTTPGGTDGTVTVSWPAVTGAVRYQAGSAPGNVTSGFTVVNTNVTSPYTFTGLSAGAVTVAIMAMAE